MIGFIGLGAAGSNVADEAASRDYPAIAINYSQRDLDSLEYIEERLKLVGSEGVGKNREAASRLMSKNWESAVSFVQENFSSPSIEIIFVCFSTGGGSGSGIAPVLLEILHGELPDKVFVAVPILPDLSEVLPNQINSIQSGEELCGLDLCVLPLDNEQVRKQYATLNLPKNKLFHKTNTLFIDSIERVLSFTTRESKNGVLDEKDLLTIFSTKGVASIGIATITDVNEHSEEAAPQFIADKITAAWKESIFSPIEMNQVFRAGVVLNAPESFIDYINMKTIFGGFRNGMPVDLFEGYYHNDEYTLCVILSGLSWYRTRLGETEEVVESMKKNAEQLLTKNEVYKSKTNTSIGLRAQEKKATKKKNIQDILKKYK
ncbi:cell division protein FtsZ [Priestia megaterium]